MKVLVWRLV